MARPARTAIPASLFVHVAVSSNEFVSSTEPALTPELLCLEGGTCRLNSGDLDRFVLAVDALCSAASAGATMTILFKDTTYSLQSLMENIRRGEIALPDIQRPFVWAPSKVRDLFDSMFKGFPVGYLLFWATDAEVGARRIGTEKKEAAPRLLVVDGQQRLTSLFAVMTGNPIVRKDFTEGRIRVAFRPSDARFEVTDAAIERDPEFVADITDLWRSYRETTRRFFTTLKERREEPMTDAEEERLEAALDRVRDLQHYPFKAVELDATVGEELVAEVFVRINSEGVTLNQADFILTLMSVWWEEGRKELEAFSRAAKQPSANRPSPYNHFIAPQPDQLLRAAVGFAFRRGRLHHVYSLLRGKDLETGKLDPDRRETQFERLRDAQALVLNLTNWHDFLSCIARAGFRGARMISSENALLYTYSLWLIGKHDFRVAPHTLREVIARWFFMAHTTGRYTTSPESQIEADFLRLRDITTGDAAAFCGRLDREIGTVFTRDYWTISLPNRLATSGTKSPALMAYWASLNLLDAEVLFSQTRVSARLDPGVLAVRDLELHHLFAKKHLGTLGIVGAARTNQIANMAFVDWADNATMGGKPPTEYWPEMSARLTGARFKQQAYWHALPVGWEQLAYDEFLAKRRPLIATVVRDGFARLNADALPASPGFVTTAEMIRSGESVTVEFKSTARWSVKGQVKDPKLEHVIVKTVAGFMNAEGGTLVIGVADDGTVLGLESDLATLGTKPDRDGYELFLTQLFKNSTDGAAHALVRISFDSIAEKEVCRIDVAASGRPVFARRPEGNESTEFWVRTGNSTRLFVGGEAVEYQASHWG